MFKSLSHRSKITKRNVKSNVDEIIKNINDNEKFDIK